MYTPSGGKYHCQDRNQMEEESDGGATGKEFASYAVLYQVECVLDCCFVSNYRIMGD